MVTTLTKSELEIVTDPEIILTKNKIIANVVEQMGALAEDYKLLLKTTSLQEKVLANAKISKGENYKGLPYVMLDFPRQFGREDVFAIRSFFWWGNFFSITLHLSGHYYNWFSPNLQVAIDNDAIDDWFISTSEDQWHHHFEDDNYREVAGEKPVVLAGRDFIKIAKKIPLIKWDESQTFFIENFSKLLSILNS